MDVAWNQVKVAGLPREEKQRLLSEVEILKELDHKNIIKLYHSWITTDKDEVSVNFITEACAQTLKKYSKKLKTNLDLRAVKSWSRQILRGLDYLHSHDPPIVHRDLKCENIFVNQNQGEVKIGDLGLAAALDNQRTKSVIGTPEFMAPELYDEDYDERVDIYSFGMCMIELVTHECPYSECSNPAQIYKRVSQGVKPEALDKIIDADLRSFIMKCISPIEKRLTAKELMNDPFLDKGSGKPREVKQHTVVEEEPEVARPGGTKQMAVLPEKSSGAGGGKKESTAAGGDESPEYRASADGDRDRVGGPGSDNGSETSRAGDPVAVGGMSRSASHTDLAKIPSVGLDDVLNASESPALASGSYADVAGGGGSPRPPPSAGDAAAVGGGGGGGEADGSSKPGSQRGSAQTSPERDGDGAASDRGSNVSGASSPEHPHSAGEGKGPKSRLATSSSRAGSTADLRGHDGSAHGGDAFSSGGGGGGGGDESGGGGHRRKGSLDFRVKGRILEDKTLRLRLRIGDASGHTRTVEFPFNTDKDSSYSVASEMIEELQLPQSDIRTVMNEIENEVKFLNEGMKKKDQEGATNAPGDGSAGAAAERRPSRASFVDGYSSGDGALDRSSPPPPGAGDLRRSQSVDPISMHASAREGRPTPQKEPPIQDHAPGAGDLHHPTPTKPALPPLPPPRFDAVAAERERGDDGPSGGAGARAAAAGAAAAARAGAAALRRALDARAADASDALIPAAASAAAGDAPAATGAPLATAAAPPPAATATATLAPPRRGVERDRVLSRVVRHLRRLRRRRGGGTRD